MPPAVEIADVWHRYGPRVALAGLSLEVAEGEIFTLLGPNGGGKTTLFRLVSTLAPLQQGRIVVAGHDVGAELDEARRRLGVVFQAPSLDRQLTVAENLWHQGQLYGLHGEPLRRRIDELLDVFRLAERRGDLINKLSGGLRRRVELAKGLLHEPAVLVLDEPSTGLDPEARNDLWNHLAEQRAQRGVTVLLTTHLFEEADKADRLAILDEGRLVAVGSPAELRGEIGGETVTIACDEPQPLAEELNARWSLNARVIAGRVRFERPAAHRVLGELIEAFGSRVHSLTYGQPTLEDVWIARTGHGDWHRTEAA